MLNLGQRSLEVLFMPNIPSEEIGFSFGFISFLFFLSLLSCYTADY